MTEALLPSPRETTPRQSPEREDERQSDADERTDTHNCDATLFTAKSRSGKRISETDGDAEHGDKRQKISNREEHTDDSQDTRETATDNTESHEGETSDREADETVAKSEDPLKTNKRQAETRESDAEDRGENGSKVKRTRRLRRGLRLCANVTCYIEQVLYN